MTNNLQKSLINAVELTKNNSKLIVNMCLNYGGKQEIIMACNKAIENGNKIDEEGFKKLLYTSILPPLDLIIRTSGEQRLSNFMLFDLAYAELYFTKQYWPDFNKKSLFKALKDYNKRDRRFGKV